MSTSSVSRSSVRRRAEQATGPVLPLVPCPDCGWKVKVYISGTSGHPGWIFYKCKHHGTTCNFWHWEREYVYHLADTNVLRGDAEVEAVGWAEERREELERALGQEKLAEGWGKGAGCKIKSDEILRSELLVQVREMLLILKITVAMLSVVMVLTLCVLIQK